MTDNNNSMMWKVHMFCGAGTEDNGVSGVQIHHSDPIEFSPSRTTRSNYGKRAADSTPTTLVVIIIIVRRLLLLL
jgi:hypothetical protein